MSNIPEGTVTARRRKGGRWVVAAAAVAAVQDDPPVDLVGHVEIAEPGPAADSGDGAPPPANRGALTLDAEVGGWCLDWIGITLPDGTDVKGIMELLGGSFLEASGGMHGYQHVARRGHVAVWWGGHSPGMGVHVDISGQGLRELEDGGIVRDWCAWLSMMRELDGRASRLDLALDDREGRLDIAELLDAVRDGRVVSRWRSPVVVTTGYDEETGEEKGKTLHFGSKWSSAQLRVYDKRQEQRAKTGLDPGPWVRPELQLRDERADAAASAIVEAALRGPDEVGAWCAGFLRGYLDVKERGLELQRYKWDTAPAWGELLGWAERVRLAVPKATKTVDTLWRWVHGRCAVALAVVDRVTVGRSWVEGLLAAGEAKLERSAVHQAALLAWEREREPLMRAIRGDGAAGADRPGRQQHGDIT